MAFVLRLSLQSLVLQEAALDGEIVVQGPEGATRGAMVISKGLHRHALALSDSMFPRAIRFLQRSGGADYVQYDCMSMAGRIDWSRQYYLPKASSMIVGLTLNNLLTAGLH